MTHEMRIRVLTNIKDVPLAGWDEAQKVLGEVISELDAIHKKELSRRDKTRIRKFILHVWRSQRTEYAEQILKIAKKLI